MRYIKLDSLQNYEYVLETTLKVFTTISLDSTKIISIKERINYDDEKMLPGTLLEYQDGKLVAQYDYHNHQFEHVVVLHVYQETGKIRVYGAKIGVQTIQILNAADEDYSIKEENELILQQAKSDTSNSFYLIRNINHSVLIQQHAQQYGK